MTETAGDVVRDALTELTVQAEEQTLPAVDLYTGVRYLNRMMAAWDAKQINLGYTEVSDPDDVLTVPAGAIEGMVFNLAMRLASQYDVSVSNSLAIAARDSMKTIRLIATRPPKAAYPSTLPIGSGNEGAIGAYPQEHFYNNPCEDTGAYDDDGDC